METMQMCTHTWQWCVGMFGTPTTHWGKQALHTCIAKQSTNTPKHYSHVLVSITTRFNQCNVVMQLKSWLHIDVSCKLHTNLKQQNKTEEVTSAFEHPSKCVNTFACTHWPISPGMRMHTAPTIHYWKHSSSVTWKWTKKFLPLLHSTVIQSTSQ